MLVSGRHASDSAIATGTRTDQFKDKPCGHQSPTESHASATRPFHHQRHLSVQQSRIWNRLLRRRAQMFPSDCQSGPEMWVTDVGSSSRWDCSFVSPQSAIALLARNRTQTVTSRSLVERHRMPSTGRS